MHLTKYISFMFQKSGLSTTRHSSGPDWLPATGDTHCPSAPGTGLSGDLLPDGGKKEWGRACEKSGCKERRKQLHGGFLCRRWCEMQVTLLVGCPADVHPALLPRCDWPADVDRRRLGVRATAQVSDPVTGLPPWRPPVPGPGTAAF